MPVIGYKQQFNNIPCFKNITFTIKFKLKYTEIGALQFDNKDDPYFDCGDYRIHIENAANKFNEQKLKEYDIDIPILSLCKYLVDTIPNIYSITYESKSSIDTYYKDEILNDYNMIKNNLNKQKSL